MKRKLFGLLCLILAFEVGHTQYIEHSIDGSAWLGLSYPKGEHKFDQRLSRNITRFAKQGWTIGLDCHAEIANGFKIGFLFSNYNVALDETGWNNHLIASLDTTGFYTTASSESIPQYETSAWSVQMAQDISSSDWLITPHFALGLSSTDLICSNHFRLKEVGSNYWKETDVNGYRSGINLAVTVGAKVGYSFDMPGGRGCVFLLGQYYRSRSTTSLMYSTKDIFQSKDESIYWASGNILYASISFGASYFLK